MYLLICEGRCNPTLPAVDAMRREYANRVNRGVPPIRDASLVAAQRRLTYTPHDRDGLNRAICLDCGTERRFGNEHGGWQ